MGRVFAGRAPFNRQFALKATRSARRPFACTSRTSEQQDPDITTDGKQIDVADLLSKPTWSLTSLLPPKAKDQSTQQSTPTITSEQLHHLLRLSALPPPSSAQEEASMLDTLSQQLHFVREIQKVDTTGVEPLRSLRDETAQGEKDAEVGLEDEVIKSALEGEEVRGKWHRRIRRRREGVVKEEKEKEERDPLGTAERNVGRFCVVEGGKDG